MGRIKEFFSDMKKEVKRIRWRKGKDLWHDVMITIIFVLFFSIFFVLVQYIVAAISEINISSIIERISDLF